MLPANQYVEVRNGGYYVAGTRIGLDVLVHDFRRGRSAESIFEAYPSLGSLAKVNGVITLILEHRSPALADDRAALLDFGQIWGFTSSKDCGLLPSRDHRERSPSDVEEYLKDQEYVFDQIKAEYPMPSDMIERFERAKKEAAPRPA
jgi:uncharacterized protein (DUF433 family)